jgi:hypothetical protein
MTPYSCMLGRLSPYRQAPQANYRACWRQVVFSFFLLFPLVLGGCYWLKYGKLMRTHVDLLISMAKKMGDVLEDHRPMTPAMMEEFSYPLERARDFVRIVSPRYGGRQSLRAFNDFLAIYAKLVEETDRLRIASKGTLDFRHQLQVLQEQGERVKIILAEEEG